MAGYCKSFFRLRPFLNCFVIGNDGKSDSLWGILKIDLGTSTVISVVAEWSMTYPILRPKGVPLLKNSGVDL